MHQLEEKVIAMEEAKFAKSRIVPEATASTANNSSKQKRFVIVDTSR